jgi:hypothetical protein
MRRIRVSNAENVIEEWTDYWAFLVEHLAMRDRDRGDF